MARHGSYDHMMAELQLDEDERAVASAVGKRGQRGHSCRPSGAKPSSSSDDERKEREPRDAATERGRSRSNNSEADEGKSGSSSFASDQSDDSREGDSLLDAVSVWLHRPNRFVVVFVHKARVRSALAEQFNARGSVDSAGASVAVGSAAAEYRVEINALRGFLTRAPKRGAPLVQVVHAVLLSA